MKANFFDSTGKKQKEFSLPAQFNEEIRTDLIRRAVLAIKANTRQRYGALPKAGQRQSANLSGRRRDYKSHYGIGISRAPRKTMWNRGTQFGWVGAFAPQTVGGRRAHPPKPHAIYAQKINTTENKKAIRSALAATLSIELVKKRGHLFDELPTVVESKIENLAKTKQVIDLLIRLGLEKELERTSERKIRAGRGKSRGRQYRTKTGPLFVVSGKCSLMKAASNIPGVEVCFVNNLNADLLAPGTDAGRLTIFTDKSLEKMDKEKLFTVKK